MEFKITAFPSEKTKNNGKVISFNSFEELSNEFKNCEQGAKGGEGFVRGELDPPIREDANQKGSTLLIIDGDMSKDKGNAIAPKEMHELLKKRNLNHFIYTSHSHSSDKNKFRCVVPCNMYNDNMTLRHNLSLLLKGSNLHFAKEMKAWSQIWFSPRREDPDDGLFEFYEYHNGNIWETIYVEESKAAKETNEKEADSSEHSETLDQLHENIRTGTEYHESLRTLSWQYVKDGMSKPNCKAILKSMMSGSVEAGTERWQIRFDEIDRLVDGIVDEESADFELEYVKTDTSKKLELPKPPGLLGVLYDSAYQYLLYQYPEIAFASAVGVVAGIAGRKFNIVEPIPSGLNLFLTIIAGTGSGKERINDFANLCIRGNDESIKSYDSFIGPSHFTSPKAIINQFVDARSRLCIVSEAGLMLKIKSGNPQGTTAFVLDAFQAGHANAYTKAQAYSKSDDSLPSVRAVAMTIVSESTPEQMYEAYADTGALSSGYLPRQLLLKIDKRQTYPNRKVNDVLPSNLRARLTELLETCSSVQAEADPKAHKLTFADGLVEDCYEYIVKYNELSAENEGIDSVKQHMATRVAQKVLRLAGLATVFNKSRDEKNCLVIEKPEWEWAKSVGDYEFEHITTALDGLSGDQEFDNACFAVYTKLVGIVDNSIKDRKCQIDVRYRKRKVVPYSKVKIACKSNNNINSINDRHGMMRTGLDKVLDDMEKKKAIRILDRDPLGGKSPRLVQLLEGMNDYAKHF